MRASNPKYGWKSGKKQRESDAAWRQWASGMAMLKQIWSEEKTKLNALWSVFDT